MIAGSSEDAAATGDLDIIANITIVAVDIPNTVVDANSIDRVFDVQVGGRLELQDLTIRRGAVGGANGGGQT